MTKNCPQCKKEFNTDNPRKIYCSPACKVRAYELRNGKNPPGFIIGDEFDIITKIVTKKITNPEYEKIDQEVAKLRDRNEKLTIQRNDLAKEIKRLETDPMQALGVLGGLGAGAALTKKIKNQDLRVVLSFASAVVGGQIMKESESQRQYKDRIINEIETQMRDIDAEINNNTKLIWEKIFYQSTLPKEIEVNETQEIKIPKKKTAQKSTEQIEGVLTASQMVEMKFDLYKLDGDMGKFFGNIAKNAFIITYGKPGSGKSTFFVQVAAYMTKFGLVFYNTAEEGVSPTFQNKIKKLSSAPNEFHIFGFNTLKQIKNALSTYDYKFCFIDSINVITDATPDEFDKLRKQFPEVCFFIIMQCNKDGNYKGSSDYSHSSDVNIEVVKGVAKTLKTRYNEDCCEYEIFKNEGAKKGYSD